MIASTSIALEKRRSSWLCYWGQGNPLVGAIDMTARHSTTNSAGGLRISKVNQPSMERVSHGRLQGCHQFTDRAGRFDFGPDSDFRLPGG